MAYSGYRPGDYEPVVQAHPYSITQSQQLHTQHVPSSPSSPAMSLPRQPPYGRFPPMAMPSQHGSAQHVPAGMHPQQSSYPPLNDYQQPSPYSQPNPYQQQYSYQQQQYSQPHQSYHQTLPQSQFNQTQPTYVSHPAPVMIPCGQPPVSPSTSEPANIEDEEPYRVRNPPPPSELHMYEDRIWELRLVQEPKRARMCGYGDRDRRPITSPPIVQLVIRDLRTNEEIDYQDTTLTLHQFICSVTICDISGKTDKSVIKGHPQQQIISASSVGGYPAPSMPQNPEHGAPRVDSSHHYAQRGYQNGQYSNPTSSAQRPWPSIESPPPGPYSTIHGPVPTPYGPRPQIHLPPPHPALNRPQPPPTPPAEGGTSPGTAFARNLIGQTCSSANLLQDEHEKWGIFFTFSDLSVRTEDWFRLKFSVFNVAESVASLSCEEILQKATENNAAPTTSSSQESGKRGSRSLDGIRNSFVNKTAPCLATVYSACFKVYSAKKFPGVAESTEISKAFAKQGMKISIRKDTASTGEKRKRTGTGEEEEFSNEDSFEQ